MNILIS